MNTIKIAFVFGLACAAWVASAESTSRVGPFTFSAGYAWRQQAKTDFKGALSLPALAGGDYEDGGMVEPGTVNWAGGYVNNVIPDDVTPGTYLYSLELTRSDSVGAGSDEDSMSGLNLAAGYDFWDNEVFAIGAQLRFAGYWGLKNSSSGGYSRYTDYFPFAAGPFPGDIDVPLPGIDIASPADPNYRKYLAGGPGGRVTLRSDLYQIGLGPKVTWHVLSCLDVYGGVEALCTFVNSELDAGGASTDEVNCLWGVGGHVGFTGWMTENIGFFGQVGYEWIDEDEVSVQGIRAETDYSSLVLSAGVQVRF